MRIARLFSIVGTCAFIFGCGGPKPQPTNPPTAKTADAGAPEELTQRKILHRKDIAEFPGKESIVIYATIPPGGRSGKHTHAGPEIVYLLSGAVKVEKEGEEPRVVNAGETFSTTANKVHDVACEGNETAKLIDFLIIEKGQPLATPVK